MDRLEVARFSTLPESELAVALLRRHGIDAQAPDRQMANSMPHLHIALGGIRVTAPDNQIAQARDIIERARRGEFGAQVQDDDGWREDATPGKVGELDEREIGGVLTGMGPLVRALIVAILASPLLTCATMNVD